MNSDSETETVQLTVNGETRRVPTAPNATLLEVLREDLGLTGTKHGCELGECGACTVLLDDEPVLSCLTLAVEAEGSAVTTVEGLGDGEPHPLQEAFVEEGAAQCGYCTSGMLLTGKHLLDEEQDPGRRDISEAISGNICRCTGYSKIISAIERAAEETAAGGDD
jgi:aerobic-type carbon monoxide dehydrogenase small subunit (CoxS/CutS family)